MIPSQLRPQKFFLVKIRKKEKRGMAVAARYGVSAYSGKCDMGCTFSAVFLGAGAGAGMGYSLSFPTAFP